MNFTRDLTAKIKKYLASDDILLITGARQAGKTTLLHQLEKVIKTKGQVNYFLNLEDPDYLSFLNKSPKNLFKIFPFDLNQKNFLFVDEVQYLDNPTNFLKFFYDEYRDKIKIIASGSSAFYLDKKFKDSLAGRKKIFHLSTLSFKEFLRFKKEKNLAQENFKNLTLSQKEKIEFYFQEYAIFGGYPRVVLAPLQKKEAVLQDIAYSYIKKDVLESGIRQEEIFYRLLKILSSQVGSLVNSSELANTLRVSRSLIEDYLYLMQKSFHLRLIHPFFKNIRKEITKMPKVYFLDTGLRNFFVKNFKSFTQREDKGQILENALFRQLLEKYDFEEIRFWRTISKKEVDFVVGDKAYEAKTNPQSFSKKKYKTFLEKYPKKKLSIVSFEADIGIDKTSSIPILPVWQI